MVSRSRIDFTKRIRTRAGSRVEIYFVHDGLYINGAYYEPQDDVWWPVQWDWNGSYGNKQSALDLVNDEPAKKVKA